MTTDWQLIQKDGRDIDEQIDSTGNVYQRSGGIIPKACQKCKTEFNNPIESVPLKQSIPLYTCSDCDFKNNGAPGAMEHMLDHPDHKILKSSEEKIVGYQNIITGNQSIITKILEDDDVIDIEILCQKCHESKS